MKYLLDTHVWILLHIDSSKLSKRVLNIISESENYQELLLSPISFIEFASLVSKGRLTINCDGETWIEAAVKLRKLRVVEINPAIAWRASQLPANFHADPADRIIVATARTEHAILITKDEAIRNYSHVETIW